MMQYKVDGGDWKRIRFTEAFAKLDGWLAVHYPKGWIEMKSHRAPYDVESAAKHGAIIPEMESMLDMAPMSWS